MDRRGGVRNGLGIQKTSSKEIEEPNIFPGSDIPKNIVGIVVQGKLSESSCSY